MSLSAGQSENFGALHAAATCSFRYLYAVSTCSFIGLYAVVTCLFGALYAVCCCLLLWSSLCCCYLPLLDNFILSVATCLFGALYAVATWLFGGLYAGSLLFLQMCLQYFTGASMAWLKTLPPDPSLSCKCVLNTYWWVIGMFRNAALGSLHLLHLIPQIIVPGINGM